MKSIAIITPMILPVPALSGGAVEELITKIIFGNEKTAKFQIDLYTIEDTALNDFHFKYTNIVQVALPTLLKKMEKYRDKMKRVLKSQGICREIDKLVVKEVCKKEHDIFVVENMSAIYRLLRRKTDKPIYFHLHNQIDLYRTVSDLGLMEERGDKILTISEYMRQAVLQVSPKAKCVCLTNSVDYSRFHPQEKNTEFMKNLGISENKTVFLYAGRILQQKGVKELIQAFLKAKEEVQGITLLLVGTGMFERRGKKIPYELEVEKLLEGESDIVVTGFVSPDKMPGIYACADVGVVPSLWKEAFGMVALEMLGMNIPMIVAKTGGLIEIVDESCAEIIDVKESFVEDLSRTMVKMAQNVTFREQMREAAKERVQCHPEFDDSTYFERFCNLID